jgi:hypothetical protein
MLKIYFKDLIYLLNTPISLHTNNNNNNNNNNNKPDVARIEWYSHVTSPVR